MYSSRTCISNFIFYKYLWFCTVFTIDMLFHLLGSTVEQSQNLTKFNLLKLPPFLYNWQGVFGSGPVLYLTSSLKLLPLSRSTSLSRVTLKEPPVSMYRTFLLISMATKAAILIQIWTKHQQCQFQDNTSTRWGGKIAWTCWLVLCLYLNINA